MGSSYRQEAMRRNLKAQSTLDRTYGRYLNTMSMETRHYHYRKWS